MPTVTSATVNAANGNRTLILIPIVHAQADLGTLAPAVEREIQMRTGAGQQHASQHASQIDRLWSEIETLLDALPLDYSRVRLYQDGLPVCGREADIVKDLARAGSRNHALLLHLMEQGATLTGTESPPLLIEEYRQLKQSLDANRETGRGAHREATDAVSNRVEPLAQQREHLLRERDSFIAERIDQTLREGETGIVFLGLLHSLKDRLRADIRVVEPLALEGGKIHELS